MQVPFFRLSRLCTYLLFLFLYLPLFFVIVSSLNDSTLLGQWGGWTLRWYQELFADEELMQAFRHSLLVACISTLCALFLGTLSAYALDRYRESSWQYHHSALIYAPLLLPEVHMGMSLLMLFVAWRLELGFISLIFAHITFCLSFATIIIRARFALLNPHTVEAAQDLGARPLAITSRIILPHLQPALLSGALLSFILSLDDFVVSFFVAGPEATTLPIYIFSMLKFGAPPLIHALSTILILLALFVSITIELIAYMRRSKGIEIPKCENPPSGAP